MAAKSHEEFLDMCHSVYLWKCLCLTDICSARPQEHVFAVLWKPDSILIGHTNVFREEGLLCLWSLHSIFHVEYLVLIR